jgi:heptosyltransferase-2
LRSKKTNILVIGPSWVGDMVMTHSLVQLIRRTEPKANIDVLAPAWCAPLIARMPEVRTLIETSFVHGALGLRERWAISKQLRGKAYDCAYILPNSFKSALVPWLAKIPVRKGYTGEQRFGLVNHRLALDKDRWPLMIQRFAALHDVEVADDLSAIPFPRLSIDTQSVSGTLDDLGLRAVDRDTMILCPGAEFGAAKQWPSHYYAELARQRVEAGWQVWLMGSKNDESVCQQIASADHRIINLAGRTSLPQAIDVMSCANLVVSNDSGLMHVAAALQRSLVAVYGSTDPAFTPPLGENAKVVRLGLDCSPCFKRQCPLGHLNCLNQLPVEMVVDQINLLLGPSSKEAPT